MENSFRFVQPTTTWLPASERAYQPVTYGFDVRTPIRNPPDPMYAEIEVHRYLAETVEFLRNNPYDLTLDELVEMTVNEISYSGTFRHLITSRPATGAPSRVGCGQPTRT